MILSTIIYLRVRNRNRCSQVILVASKFGRHCTSAAISFFPGEYLKVSCSSLTLKMKRASLIYTKNWLGGNDFRQNSLGICRNKTSIFPQSLVFSCLIKLCFGYTRSKSKCCSKHGDYYCYCFKPLAPLFPI